MMTDVQKTEPAGAAEAEAEAEAKTEEVRTDGAEEPGADDAGKAPAAPKQKPGEIGGPQGPEPTRYGDWEVGGRCSDF